MMRDYRDHKVMLVPFLFLVFLVLIPLVFYSHVEGGTELKHVSSLLSPQQLKRWIDRGYRDDRGLKVVILDTSLGPSARSDYDSGHIPGAYYVDYIKELIKTRSDGPMMVAVMVPDGPQMDAHIRKYGIDKDTVVVFTGHHVWWVARAYWTYRYWGFPQEHLFILNGKATTDKSVWKAAGYELETKEPPLPAPSRFSVGNWPGNMDTVRATLPEFMDVASGKTRDAVILDTRSDAEWNGELPGGIMYNTACAFRAKNSVWKEWAEELVGANYTEKSTGSHVFKSKEQILSEYNAMGLTEDKVIYGFCSSGVRSTVAFFIFDGILGWKGKYKSYDGSAREIGQLAYVQNKDGMYNLPKDSRWRWDIGQYTSILNCQDNPGNIVAPQGVNPYATTGRDINEFDKKYYKK